MAYAVTVQTVTPRILAAVHRQVKVGEVAKAFAPALDQVWAFLRSHLGLRSDGHNIFLYHHATGQAAACLEVDFGVEVTRHFQAQGPIACVETPAGRAAVVVHRGGYSGMAAAHAALHRWCSDNGELIGRCSWEIYGDHNDDPSKLETTIFYLLA
jgi:effector-binding domain-containing protein